MTNAEQSVLAAIAELEAEENPDDITELVRWQIETGLLREGRGRFRPGEYVIAAGDFRRGTLVIDPPIKRPLLLALMASLPQWDLPDGPLESG